MPEAKESGGSLFVVLPMEVLHDPTISHAAKLTYARLAFYAGRDGRCNPSHDTLATEVCLKPRQVRTVLGELKKRGWLTWKRTRSSCWYTVSGPISDRQKTATLESEIGRKLPIRVAENCQSRVAENCLQKDVLLKEELKDHTQERTVVPDSQWKEFAALYPPNRLDTENAERAFLTRNAEGAAIMEGLRLSVTSEQWCKESGRYVPRASKWITEGAYRDAARLAQPTPSQPDTMDPDLRRRIREKAEMGSCDPETWRRIKAARDVPKVRRERTPEEIEALIMLLPERMRAAERARPFCVCDPYPCDPPETGATLITEPYRTYPTLRGH